MRKGRAEKVTATREPENVPKFKGKLKNGLPGGDAEGAGKPLSMTIKVTIWLRSSQQKKEGGTGKIVLSRTRKLRRFGKIHRGGSGQSERKRESNQS